MKGGGPHQHSPVEVSPDKLLDAGLAAAVHVLELVHGGELLHVQPVGGDHVWTEEQRNRTGVRG